MRYLLGFGLAGWWYLGASLVWADYRATLANRVDLGALTSEFKRSISNLEGCDVTHDVLTCRRLTDDFSPEEVLILTQALQVHDPDVRLKQRQEEQASTQEIPLSTFGGVVGGLAGAASLVIVARKASKKDIV